jgi:predicted ATPase/class 3 adenylate cyclase
MSDVRALLLTDVVDSTRLAEAIGDAAMADAWAAHDRVARDLLQQHGGREIDKTDGMLMMFEQAADAVAFAMDYHPALSRLAVPLSARAGLHVGPVILRYNSADDVALGAKPIEVEGLAKPTAARVMAIARGGQTLLTTDARDALGATDLKLESHGHWIVKGVDDPIELFEVARLGTRCVAPADSEKAFRVIKAADWWMPVKDIPNNLPFQSTSFVGRDAELDDVKSLLEKARLVTLLGMGGLGKTRLCLQVAAETMHRFPDGVWFLDLAPLRDKALVVAEANKVVGVQAEPDRTPLQSLCARLKVKRALLVLDNCEHLVATSAELCHAVMRDAPHVRFIATSREALRVPGEQGYPLHPLPLPASNAGLEELAQSAAVRLFVERARQGKPSFVLDAAQAPGVAELVARLEGIPLALELAAARMRALSVNDINVRLKDRFKLLVGGARVLQERQQTLRALVDWSYDLLPDAERVLLSRLGVFVGGFDLESAESVCGTEPLPPEDVLDLLASLVDKSLVMLDESDERTRYRMLETIRDYGQEKLESRGELATMSTRHCEHFFGLSKQARDGWGGPEQAEWIQRIESDLDNVRSAMACALTGAVDPFVAVKFAVALERFWELRGYASEGRGYMRAVLQVPTVLESDVAHAWALYVSAQLAESQSDYAEDRRMLEDCLVLRRRLANPVDIAATLSTLSTARLHTGDVDGARECELEALEIFRKVGHRQGEAIGLFHLGQIAIHLGDDEEARDLIGQALKIAGEIKYQELETVCDLASGELSFEAADFEQAARSFSRGYTVARDAADKRGEANALRWLGASDLHAGNLVSARSRLTEAMQALRKLEMWEELLSCLEDYAELLSAEDAVGPAVRIIAAASKAREGLGLERSPRAEGRLKTRIAHYRERAPDFKTDWSLGSGWSVDDAIFNALAHAQRETVAQATP